MKRSTQIKHIEAIESFEGDEMCGAYVVTENEMRQRQWLMAFGVTRLPVKHPQPRWQVIRDTFNRSRNELAFDLDASRLSPERVSLVARLMGITPGQVDRYPIPALGCEVVEYEDNETAESQMWERPFSFLGAKTGAIPNYA